MSGQQLAAARTLSLPSTCFIGGHLVELTVPAALASAAGKFGDGPALAEPGGPRIGYHQLLHQTTTVTRALIAEGVTPEDRVAIWSPNTHQWVLAAFGALSAGATLVPVSTRFTGPEALDVITRSGAVRADRRPIASSAPTGSPHFAPPPRPRPPKRRAPAPVPKIPQRQNETCRVTPAPQGNCASWSACRCRVPRNRGRQPTRGTGSSAARPLLARPDRAAAEMIQMHGAIGITWNTTPTVISSARTVRPSCSAGPDEHIARVAAALIDG